MQRALMQCFKPENYFMVREALLKAGRGDLIGNGCDCLIPAQPPKAALRARMEKANQSLGEGKYVHQIPNPGSIRAIGPAENRHEGGRGKRRAGEGNLALSKLNLHPPMLARSAENSTID
jgi:hypothetical protein